MPGSAFTSHHRLLGAVSLLLLLQTACSDDDLKKASEQLKSVQQGIANVAPVTNNGVTLGPTPEIKSETCFATFTPPVAGRAGVLQLTSYKSPSEESFPSVYFRAIVDSTNRAVLDGKTITGELYIQTQKGGPVWATSWEQPASFKVSASGEWSITVEVTNLELQRADQEGKARISGKLVGSWQ